MRNDGTWGFGCYGVCKLTSVEVYVVDRTYGAEEAVDNCVGAKLWWECGDSNCEARVILWWLVLDVCALIVG